MNARLPNADNISRFARRCAGPKNNVKNGPYRELLEAPCPETFPIPSRRLRAHRVNAKTVLRRLSGCTAFAYLKVIL
jgi:hypothetical protein